MNSLGPCGVGRGYPSNAWSTTDNIFRTVDSSNLVHDCELKVDICGNYH
jgi:hypothetical protein